MSASGRWLLVSAAIAGATGVAIGAFGAHGLDQFLLRGGADPEWVAKRISQFETGSRYHLIHALALLGLAALAVRGAGAGQPAAGLRPPAILFIAGILLFSGSLYLLVLTNTPWLGAITPIGGVCWIVAWAWLGFVKPSRSEPAPPQR